MISILGFLARLSIIGGFFGAIFVSISDIMLKTNYLDQFDDFVDLRNPRVKVIIGLISIFYLLVFLLSCVNKFTKYSQNRKVKNKNGEIEVSIKTINEAVKEFLGNKEIIKNSKIKSYPKGKAVVIEAIVDTYNVDNLNEKLVKIQEEMSDFVYNATGITVKKSKVKLKKVLGETIIEKKIVTTPEEETQEGEV